MDKELLQAIVDQAIEFGRTSQRHEDACDDMHHELDELNHLLSHAPLSAMPPVMQ